MVLLCSTRYIKDNICNDNIEEKYLLVAIREVQQTRLKQILGYQLTERLMALVGNSTIAQYPAYYALLNKCQDFLAYSAMAKVVVRLAYKTANIGVAQNSDTNINAVQQDIVEQTRREYQSMADSYCDDLQGYILDNRTSYPELSANTGHQTRPTLDSSANTGLMLGGARGK